MFKFLKIHTYIQDIMKYIHYNTRLNKNNREGCSSGIYFSTKGETENLNKSVITVKLDDLYDIKVHK